jgi:ankyrin repeat protein
MPVAGTPRAVAQAVKAINRHRTTRLEKLLDRGLDPDGFDDNGFPLLHHAVFSDNLAAVKLLVSSGAAIDIINDLGFTAMHQACIARNHEIFTYLHRHGGDAFRRGGSARLSCANLLFATWYFENCKTMSRARNTHAGALDEGVPAPFYGRWSVVLNMLRGDTGALRDFLEGKDVVPAMRMDDPERFGDNPARVRKILDFFFASDQPLVDVGNHIDGAKPVKLIIRTGDLALLQYYLDAIIEHGLSISHPTSLLPSALAAGNEEAFKYLLSRGMELSEPFSLKECFYWSLEEGLYEVFDSLDQRYDFGTTFGVDGFEVVFNLTRTGNTEALEHLKKRGYQTIPDSLATLFMAMAGDLEGLKAVPKDTPYEHIVDRYGRGLLQYAVMALRPDRELIEYLLESYSTAIITLPDGAGMTSLDYAANQNNAAVLELLFSRLDTASRKRLAKGDYAFGTITPVPFPVVRYYHEYVRRLDPTSEELRSYILDRIKDNDYAAVRYFVKEGMDLDADMGYGRTVLHQAVQYEHHPILLLLLRHGANPDTAYKDDLPALHVAIRQGDLRAIQVLLRAGAKLTYGDSFLPNALFSAYRDTTLLDFFITKGLDLRSANKFGTTPFLRFLDDMKLWDDERRDEELPVVAWYLRNGVDVERVDSLGNRPILMAATYGHDGLIELLLEAGADASVRDKHGGTVLHRYLRRLDERRRYDTEGKREYATLEKLAGLCGCINAEDAAGEMPLMEVDREDAELVRIMLNHGADPRKKNKHGQSFADRLERCGYCDEVNALLEQFPAVPEREEDTGR